MGIELLQVKLRLLPIGTTFVMFFRKIRPLRSNGVAFLCVGPRSPGCWRGDCIPCFCNTDFKVKELLFLTLGGVGRASLQQMIIFSNRKMLYSRSISNLGTIKVSWRRSRPKFSRWWPFQLSTRLWRVVRVCSFSTWRWASMILSALSSS